MGLIYLLKVDLIPVCNDYIKSNFCKKKKGVYFPSLIEDGIISDSFNLILE